MRTRTARTPTSPTWIRSPRRCPGADVVALLTEWDEFRMADPEALGDLVAHNRIVDGRHALDANAYRASGWE